MSKEISSVENQKFYYKEKNKINKNKNYAHKGHFMNKTHTNKITNHSFISSFSATMIHQKGDKGF